MSAAAATAAVSAAAAAAAQLPKFRYLSAWFCPYAHRCTLALEHHAARIEYEWVEALGWYQKDNKNDDNKNQQKVPNEHNTNNKATAEVSGDSSGRGDTASTKEWYYHWKADELKRTNPSGLVPTLIPVGSDGTTPDESRAVWESLVTVEYCDAVSGATGFDRLVPVQDPYQTARCRIWADRVNRECCSPYYGVLVRKEESERQHHFATLIAGLTAFSAELDRTDGPLFLGNAQLSSVDIALIPWAYRFYVLVHYRGSNYSIPTTDALLAYHRWFDHVMNLDSVKRTLPDKDRYLDHIAKYADGTARSKVANAVRRGVSAHDLDDVKDEYTG
jgi:glutathione S-transferase